MNTTDKENPSSLKQLRSFSIKLGENLYLRFSKHFQLLKYVKKNSQTKKGWIEEAFMEKLEAERELTPDSIKKEKYLHFQINPQLYDKIEQRVSVIKRFRNFSKKQWMVEAIYAKLEKEEQEAKNLMQNMLDASNQSQKIN